MEHAHDHKPHHHDHQPHHHDQAHPQSADHDQRRVLDLDAEVFGDNLADVLNRSGVRDARVIVDLGAGTGTGSRLLRATFPHATVTAVDNDAQMLDVLREQGFTVVKADLDQGFPELDPEGLNLETAPQQQVDLVWASSSLHHVSHVAGLLSGTYQALAPRGVLVVVELVGLPSFLIDPVEAELEERCHAAAAAEGWNHYPDWTPVIEAAGFEVTKSEVTTAVPTTAPAREYAQRWFSRFLHLATLSDDDRVAVQDLLTRFADNPELRPRTSRTVWVATPLARREHQ